jgi:Fic family protein
MKVESPPPFQPDYGKYFESIKLPDIQVFLNETDHRYFYWTELKRRPHLPFSTAEEAWALVKLHRSIAAERLKVGRHWFQYNLTSAIQKDLHLFDLKLIGGLYEDSITPQDQDEFFQTSLVEEAIASSQIEGAATTTDVARDMIQSGRSPRNVSEQMIANNYAAIRGITTRLAEPLSEELILDIHTWMTAKTEASQYAGRLRDHPIYVKDHITGDIVFHAPNSEEVQEMVDQLIAFVNDEDHFIHPIIKASILHCLIGYIHPFGDGNGRTARALFYWFLIKKGYSLLRHISISKAILQSRTAYDKAYLHTEADDNDLTYFILYSMKSLRVAFQDLIDYRDQKRTQRVQATQIMYALVDQGLNSRQSELLAYLYLKPTASMTIAAYATRHDIVRQTASRDLTELEEKGILIKKKDGKTVKYQLSHLQALQALLP